jgi:hypothetical protein
MARYQVPLDKFDGVMSYPEMPLHGPTKWVDASYEFQGTLLLKTYERGRSAARFLFSNAERPEQTFPFAMAAMADMLHQVTLERGKVSGRFGVRKQGQNYSMVYLGPLEVTCTS